MIVTEWRDVKNNNNTVMHVISWGGCLACRNFRDDLIICRSTESHCMWCIYCSPSNSTTQTCNIYLHLLLFGPPFVLLLGHSKDLHNWCDHSYQDSIFCQRYHKSHLVSHVGKNLERIHSKRAHLPVVEVSFYQMVLIHYSLLSRV